MLRGTREHISDDAVCALAGAVVLLLQDGDMLPYDRPSRRRRAAQRREHRERLQQHRHRNQKIRQIR